MDFALALGKRQDQVLDSNWAYHSEATKLVEEGVIERVEQLARGGTLRWKEERLSPFGAKYWITN